MQEITFGTEKKEQSQDNGHNETSKSKYHRFRPDVKLFSHSQLRNQPYLPEIEENSHCIDRIPKVHQPFHSEKRTKKDHTYTGNHQFECNMYRLLFKPVSQREHRDEYERKTDNRQYHITADNCIDMCFKHKSDIDGKVTAESQGNGKTGENTKQQKAVTPCYSLHCQCTDRCLFQCCNILYRKNDHCHQHQQSPVGQKRRHHPKTCHHTDHTRKQQWKDDIVHIDYSMSCFKHNRDQLCHGTEDDHHDKAKQKQMHPSGYICLRIGKVRRKKEQCTHRQQIKHHPCTEKG